MDLIAGLANMRARNYAIPEVDRLQAKLIAGRIVPAVATVAMPGVPVSRVAYGPALSQVRKFELPTIWVNRQFSPVMMTASRS